MKKEKSELEIEFEQTIDFLKKRMSEYEFEYDKKLRDIKFLEEENKKLKEKVETLELWLDNKEKLNEEYRKQIDKYKRQYEHSMWEDDELIYEEWLYD